MTFNDPEFYISISSLAVALASAAVALLTQFSQRQQNNATNAQFESLNQGYLQVSPMVLPHRSSLDMKDIRPDGTCSPSAVFDCLQMHAELLNIGNLPLNYEVVELNFAIGERPLSPGVDADDARFGVLYPKQGVTYSIKTRFIDALKKEQYTSEQISKFKIFGKLVIKYWGREKSLTKVVSRNFKVTLFKGNASGCHISIDDYNDTW